MKSQTKSSTGPEDGPEEGEIVSDDLEDISDESMIFTPNTGKSLSRSARLHGLSLSSVTDLDEPLLQRRRKRRKSYCERRARRRKRSRKKIVDSDSSDNEMGVDKKLKLQLKAAVRVDVEEAHRNSLRTRLRAMVNDGSGPESEPEQTVVQNNNPTDSPLTIIDLVEQDTSSCIEIVASGSDKAPSAPETSGSAAENNDSASDQIKPEEIDSELIQLRLEALKTAINNKFANKKKRKKDDTNKENTSNNSKENQLTKAPVSENISPQTSNEAENNVPPSPDEDEDVLRALLLASISKKITKIQPEPSKLSTQTKLTITNQNKIFLNQMKTNNFKLNNNMKRVLKGATKLIKVPQVKPLIINLNSDSDSDWELSSSPEKSPKKPQIASNTEIMSVAQDLEAKIETSKTKCPDLNKTVVTKTDTIETTVEKFLKQQRAEVESKRTTSENVSEVDSGTATSVINTLPKPPVVIEKKKTAAPVVTPEQKKTRTLPELEKSALKFLPESKREEYKKLQHLLKLKKAQMKRPKARRLSQKLNDNANNLIKSVINNGTLKTYQANAAKPNTINNGLNKQTHQIMQQTNHVSAMVPNQNGTTFSVKRTVHSKASQTEITKLRKPVQLSQKSEARLEEFRCQEVRAAMREKEKKHESLVLRATLKQLQTKRDGRLQIQEKYENLRPLVKKLNEVSKGQKHWDQEVERLIAELAKAREMQDGLHRDMLVSVKELADEKKKIDVSLTKVIAAKPKPNHPITSTPIKPSASSASLTTNSLLTSSISANDISTLVQETDNSSKNVLNTWEQSTIRNNQTELSVMDPNDIDNIIKKTEERVAVLEKNDTFKCRKSEKLKYVSPLDALKRHDVLDPFGIMCPFEVNGTCKDPECAFNHLP